MKSHLLNPTVGLIFTLYIFLTPLFFGAHNKEMGAFSPLVTNQQGDPGGISPSICIPPATPEALGEFCRMYVGLILLEVTPKARQPLLSCLLYPVSPSRSHVHTSGTRHLFEWCLVICLTVNPLKVLSR